MRVPGVVRGVLFASVVLLGAATPSGPALDVRLHLEPDHIIVGQPVWIVVDVTNRSPGVFVVEGASNCFETPLHIDIPAAQSRRSVSPACAHPAEDCQTELIDIAPGETVRRRYALQGNFMITAAGDYGVGIHDTIRYGTVAGSPKLDHSQAVKMTARLIVSPADPKKLLSIETSLARRAVVIAPRPSPPPHADIETLRRFYTVQRAGESDDVRERYALADGLARYPAAGMEPAFTAWLDRQNFYEFGLLALYHLNTTQARAILAQRAEGVSSELPPLEYNIERWLAVYYLSRMGDTSYLPLLEKLAYDPSHDVQRMAVSGVGRLGRGDDLELLAQLARSGKTVQDRIDAIQAIAETGSLKAVSVLIDLFALPNADQPNSSNNALYELTHHQIEDVWRSDPVRAQQLWQKWWMQNHATAKAYPPVNCEF